MPENDDVRGSVERIFGGGVPDIQNPVPRMTPYTLQPDLPLRTFTVDLYDMSQVVIKAHGHSVGAAGDLQLIVQRGGNTCVIETFAAGRWQHVEGEAYTREQLETAVRELDSFQQARVALLQSIQLAEDQDAKQRMAEAHKLQANGAVNSGRNLLRKH